MWIMVSGPYTAGGADDAVRAERLREMNLAAVALSRMGHVPVIGVNMALPMIAAAGAGSFDELMMPVSLALAERCDACLRIGGPSRGADDEMERFRAVGKPVYARVEDVPPRGVGCRLFPMLSVASLETSVGFYASLGGREKYRFPPAGEAAFVTLGFGDTEVGLGKLGEPLHGRAQRPASGHRIELCVYVDDVDAAAARVGRVVLAPADQPWGERVAYVEDPDGNLVMLAAPTR